VKGAQALTSAERYSLVGVGVAGVAMMFVAAFAYKAPIFKARVETAQEASPAVHVGTD
jgi:hypothetical protein